MLPNLPNGNGCSDFIIFPGEVYQIDIGCDKLLTIKDVLSWVFYCLTFWYVFTSLTSLLRKGVSDALLLGIPALLRFLIGLVPLFIGYVASFLARLATRTGLIAFALVALITTTVTLLMQYLAEVMYNGLPADFSHLMASVLPDHFQACVNVIMVTRISVFVFDLKQKFLDYANRVI